MPYHGSTLFHSQYNVALKQFGNHIPAGNEVRALYLTSSVKDTALHALYHYGIAVLC